jgi:hypothetical protein
MSPLAVGLIIAGFSVTLASVFGAFVRLSARMQAFEILISQLDTKVSPLWARVQTVIATDLHHPHVQYAEMDSLLEELTNLTISPTGRERLKVLLLERSKDMDTEITQDQRDSAILMIHVMDKVVKESKEDLAGGTGNVSMPEI